MNYAIELNNVSVKYGRITALEEINLKVTENEFLGIIGPNGGGKTTLIKLLTGLIKPDSGEVKIYGKTSRFQDGLIGYVPQFSSFDNTYPVSVSSVVSMGLLAFKDKPKAGIIEEALNTMQIYNLKDELIGNLSGGQKQRVLIARALVSEPKILLLDEPTASIDTKTGLSIYELLNRLNQKATIVLVSHDIGAISMHVKKIACLNKRLIYHDDKEVSNEMLEKTYECPVDLIAHGVPHRVLEDHHNH